MPRHDALAPMHDGFSRRRAASVRPGAHMRSIAWITHPKTQTHSLRDAADDHIPPRGAHEQRVRRGGCHPTPRHAPHVAALARTRDRVAHDSAMPLHPFHEIHRSIMTAKAGARCRIRGIRGKIRQIASCGGDDGRPSRARGLPACDRMPGIEGRVRQASAPGRRSALSRWMPGGGILPNAENLPSEKADHATRTAHTHHAASARRSACRGSRGG